MKEPEYYFRLLKTNKKMLIAATVVILISAAAVFFILYGKSNTITIEQAKTEAAHEKESGKESDAKVFVDISGCVKKPGVYEVSPESRIFEAIEMAGGVTPDADTSTINQAQPVQDGQKINVPSKEEIDTQGSGGPSPATTGKDSSGRININTADSSLLQEIPGVGPATAEKIITYREQNGYFSSPDDIKNVSGIGDKTYEKLKGFITC